jgi:hypothetical protein
MQISQAASLATGFKKWSIAHPPSIDDDDNPGGPTPIALTDPDLDDRVTAPPEQPHRPWLVPGFGTL